MNGAAPRTAYAERLVERYDGDDPLSAILAKWEAEDLREQLDQARHHLERLKSDTGTIRHAVGIIARWFVPAGVYSALRLITKR